MALASAVAEAAGGGGCSGVRNSMRARVAERLAAPERVCSAVAIQGGGRGCAGFAQPARSQVAARQVSARQQRPPCQHLCHQRLSPASAASTHVNSGGLAALPAKRRLGGGERWR